MPIYSLRHKLTSAFYSILTMTFLGGLFFSSLTRPGSDYPIGWVNGWAIGAAISTFSLAACLYFADRLAVDGGRREYAQHALAGLFMGVVAYLAYALFFHDLTWTFDTTDWMLKTGIMLLGSFAACDYHILLTKEVEAAGKNK